VPPGLSEEFPGHHHDDVLAHIRAMLRRVREQGMSGELWLSKLLDESEPSRKNRYALRVPC